MKTQFALASEPRAAAGPLDGWRSQLGCGARHGLTLAVMPLVAALLSASGPNACAKTSIRSEALDTGEFALISTRNIFDASRREHVVTPPIETNVLPQVRVDYVACVGVMQYEKGPYVFFEGSQSAYRQVLQVSDSIAGYKIAAIEKDSIRLVGATNELQVPVGAQLRRVNDGPWQVTTGIQLASLGTESRPAGVWRNNALQNIRSFRGQQGSWGRSAQSAARPSSISQPPPITDTDPEAGPLEIEQ